MINGIINSILWGTSGGGALRAIQYPQDRPTLTTPQTRAAAGLTVAGILFQVDLTSKHVILSGTFADGLAINGIENALGDPLLLTNENASTIIGALSLTPASAITVIGDTNNLELWGLDKDTPLVLRSDESGLVFNPQIGGSTIRMYNMLAEDVGYSGFLFTVPSSGGSYHRKTIGGFLNVDGLVTEGEGLYFGHVSTDTPHNYLALVHCAAKDKGRNGFQHKWGLKARCYNHTYRNIAQVADTAQNQAFQVEVSKDTILYDFIFDGAKYSMNLFTHDLIVDGGFTRWTVGAGYIGVASDFWPAHANLNGVKVLFRNHTFILDNGGAAGYVAQWAETGCDLEFQNCRFSANINASIVQDIRVGGSNSLIGTTTTNGNTSVAKATLLAQLPTYLSDDPYNKDFSNINPTAYWAVQGAGKGSQSNRTTEILDVKEVVGQTVVYGTVFGDLTLPSTLPCFLSTGQWEDLPINWAVGSYDGDVDGVYTVYGTPVGYTNTDNNRSEAIVTVEAYVNPDTVRINLTGAAGTYVGSGNWNNILATGFATGAQTIKGDNAGSTLASLRRVGGTLTGYGLTINTGFDTGALGEDSGGGIFPDAAIIGTWANPGASGTSRTFKFTGLDNAKTYIIKTLSSVDVDITGSSHLVTIQVSGASGGSTVTNYEADGNKTVLNTFTGCVPTGGEITIRVEKRTAGQAVINAIEFEWS